MAAVDTANVTEDAADIMENTADDDNGWGYSNGDSFNVMIVHPFYDFGPHT